MKKFFGVAGATIVVLILIGSFVVYPSMAASTARDEILQGIADIAKSSDVKVSDVTVDVEGTNGITALAGGKKVGDIAIRIGRIEFPEEAASGATPKLTKRDKAEAADGLQAITDALEDVGSVKLTVGDAVSGKDTIPLNDSSFTLSEDDWALVVRVPQKSVEDLLADTGLKFSATAKGPDITASFKLADLPTQKTRISVRAADGGHKIVYTVDGQEFTERVSDRKRKDNVRVMWIEFSSADDLYSVSISGKYDAEVLREQIEHELDSIERDGSAS